MRINARTGFLTRCRPLCGLVECYLCVNLGSATSTPGFTLSPTIAGLVEQFSVRNHLGLSLSGAGTILSPSSFRRTHQLGGHRWQAELSLS